MKATLYKITTAGLVVFAFVYAFTLGTAHAEISTTAGASADTTATPPVPPKPPVGAGIQNRLQQNKDARNNLLEQRQDIRTDRKTTVQGIRQDAKTEIKDMRADAPCTPRVAMGTNAMASASVSPSPSATVSVTGQVKPPCSPGEMVSFKRDVTAKKQTIVKQMEAKVFQTRKDALVKELNLSLTNLSEISTRINTRITKAESEGKVLTDARALLVTANDKLAKAKTDVAAFQAMADTATSTTANVDLTKPRALGDTAIKSVKDARDAYQKVVASIAKTLGYKVDAKGEMTPPTTTPASTPVATPAATN